jgi:hypothetical protein
MRGTTLVQRCLCPFGRCSLGFSAGILVELDIVRSQHGVGTDAAMNRTILWVLIASGIAALVYRLCGAEVRQAVSEKVELDQVSALVCLWRLTASHHSRKIREAVLALFQLMLFIYGVAVAFLLCSIWA